MNPSYIKFSLMKTINSMQDDVSSFVQNPGKDFTRNRICTFSSLIFCILSMESHRLNTEIGNYFSKVNSQIPTKSAFVQQRDKLNENAFPFILHSLNRAFPFKKQYKGYHLIACDGSDINIPPSKVDSLTRVRSNTVGSDYHQFHVNALYDILEERYVDVYPQPRSEFDEREAFLSFVRQNPIRGKCLYLADRGYFSLNVVATLQILDAAFLFRVNSVENIRSFFGRFSLPDDEEFDIQLNFKATRSRRKEYAEHPDKYVYIRPDRKFEFIPVEDKKSLFTISFRFVKVKLSDDSYEYLITNLPEKSFDIQELKKLYNLRWGIETSFRFLKYNIGLNYFHSVKRTLIIQEIYARIIMYNFTMLLVHCVKVEKKNTKYEYKVSVSDAIDTSRTFLIERLKNGTIKENLLKYLTPIKPGRSFERKIRSKRFVSMYNRV